MEKYNNILSNLLKIDVKLIKWLKYEDKNYTWPQMNSECGSINRMYNDPNNYFGLYCNININGSIINIKYRNIENSIEIAVNDILILFQDTKSSYIEITYFIFYHKIINLTLINSLNYFIKCNIKHYILNKYYKYYIKYKKCDEIRKILYTIYKYYNKDYKIIHKTLVFYYPNFNNYFYINFNIYILNSTYNYEKKFNHVLNLKLQYLLY